MRQVIEGHCHLASTKAVPEAFFSGIASNMVAALSAQGKAADSSKIMEMLKAQHGDHNGDRLVAEIRRAGIQHGVLLAPDFSFALEKEPGYEKLISHHVEVCKRHDGVFTLFGGVDPRWGTSAIDYFESQVRVGNIKGLKLYPPCGYSPSDKICYPLYEVCQKYRIPVLYHTGPTSPALTFKYADPFLIDEAAKNFSDVIFIAAHGAINFWREHLMLAKFRPNIYLDISGFPAIVGEGGWKKHLRNLFLEGLNHKIIYGTDWPIFRSNGSMKNILNMFLGENGVFENVSERDVALIMNENMNKILNNRVSRY